MNAVPPPPSLGGMGRTVPQNHHIHGQGVPSMPSQLTAPSGSQRERSIRSIFVGNIPYEATEEQLIEIFREVGPVVSFRLVHDKETGRPKGYGFCEYQDSETAASAVRNLSARELHGRTLRVDSSANAKMQQRSEDHSGSAAAMAELPPATRLGSVDPADAPKVIAKAVDSLSARHVFDILTHLKDTARNYPEEAHQMLASHPHVAYATLLAQVAMGLVDPDIAEGLLHPTRPPVPVLTPLDPTLAPATTSATTQNHLSAQRRLPGTPAHSPNDYERESRGPGHAGMQRPAPTPPPQPSTGVPGSDHFDAGFGPRGPRVTSSQTNSSSDSLSPVQRTPSGQSHSGPAANMSALRLPPPGGALPGTDKEKAELVMQVLNLTEKDLQLLTPEQRESVRLLKQQVSSAIK